MSLTMDTAATVDQLAADVAALRRELAALRDSLAVEVRTRRVIVADADRTVELSPGQITVCHDAAGSFVALGAYPDRAEVVVEANDVLPIPAEGPQQVAIVAWSEWDCVPGGPHAEVTVNSEPLAVPART